MLSRKGRLRQLAQQIHMHPAIVHVRCAARAKHGAPKQRVPQLVQHIMLAAPTTHFVEIGQAVLYRSAGIDVVWKPFLWLAVIGCVPFALALARFRKTIGKMA